MIALAFNRCCFRFVQLSLKIITFLVATQH